LIWNWTWNVQFIGTTGSGIVWNVEVSHHPVLACWPIRSLPTRPTADIAELDGGKVANVSFPDPNELTFFKVTVKPDTGYWKGATYDFSFTIPAHYPHEPPKVECQTLIYHPNIDLQGKVCLNILREDWKPVLDINSVIYGLIYLFYEPNPDDPLNHEAADLFRKDVKQFERLVDRTLRGGTMDGVSFEKLI
jgi:ubiquitin-conjugating enzyme E2 M